MIPVQFIPSYIFCPRKLFLEKVLKLEVLSRENTLKSLIKQEAFELINKKEKEFVMSVDQKPAFSQLLERYKSNHTNILREVINNHKPELVNLNISLIDIFKNIRPYLLIDSNVRAEKLFDFIIKKNVFGEELWNSLTPKIKSSYKLESSEIMMGGFVDRIEIYDDAIMPVEIKFGKVPKTGVWNSHKIEMSAYLSILDSLGKNADKGMVVYSENNESRFVSMNTSLKDKVFEIRDSVIDLLDKKQLPDFVDNKNKCESCLLKDKCYDKSFISQKLMKVP